MGVTPNHSSIFYSLGLHLMTIFQNDFNHPSGNGETGFTLQTVDKTMKFVTSTIQGVRKWSEYRDQIPLVFEIFGRYI